MMKNTTEPNSYRAQLVPILFLAGMAFFNVLTRAIFSPLLLTIEEDLGLSHAEAASFFMLISIGASLAMFFSGFVSSRINHRRTIILAGVLSGLSFIAISISSTLMGIRVNLVLLGIGAGLYLPSGIAMINALVVTRDLGKALATHELGPTLGLVAAPILTGMFMNFLSWKNIILILGTAYLLMTLFFTLFRRGSDLLGLRPDLKNLKLILTQPSFWIITSLFCIHVGGEQGVYSLLPTYLVSEKGMDKVFVNNLFGMSRISVVFVTLISGWLVDRFGIKRSMVVIVLASGTLITLLGISSGVYLLIIVFLQPAFISCFFPAGFVAVSKIGPRHSINVAISIMIPIAILFGMGIVPSLLGILGEYGTFALGFNLLGIMVLLGAVFLFFLRFTS